MQLLFVLLPLALLFAALMVGLFIWAVRKGQFEDLETPPLRILFDDEPVEKKPDGQAPADGKDDR